MVGILIFEEDADEPLPDHHEIRHHGHEHGHGTRSCTTAVAATSTSPSATPGARSNGLSVPARRWPASRTGRSASSGSTPSTPPSSRFSSLARRTGPTRPPTLARWRSARTAAWSSISCPRCASTGAGDDPRPRPVGARPCGDSLPGGGRPRAVAPDHHCLAVRDLRHQGQGRTGVRRSPRLQRLPRAATDRRPLGSRRQRNPLRRELAARGRGVPRDLPAGLAHGGGAVLSLSTASRGKGTPTGPTLTRT